jgi:DNA-binding transcriptional LysR family regulator
MEMHQIRYFMAVAETLNFTRAARRCNVTQPAMSRAIQALEAGIGGLLFRRERGLSHLTDLGRIMRPYLEQILRESEKAKGAARDYLTMGKAPLRIGVMCTIGPLRFTPFLSRFRLEHSGIELGMIDGVPAYLSDKLENGEIEAAVMAQPAPFRERFEAVPLYREPFVVATPPGHRLLTQKMVALRDIDGEDYVDRIHCEYGSYIGELMDREGVRCKVVYESDREEWVQMMVMSGAGIACLPQHSPLLPGLGTRPMHQPNIVREVSLVTMAGRRQSPAAMAFVASAKSYDWAL